jgi:transcriptional regulator with XRE-family HTH domain
VMKRGQLQAIGRRIQEIRRERKMTQGTLAERAELTANYIGKIERGEAQPTLEALLAIAEALRVSVSNLFLYLDRSQSKEEIKGTIKELLNRL